ncbi:MAG: alpha/beta hydrolase [Proteobacteria bacterium]|nr:alpha/beta hydrolase [Pseudomonadota bacterium]
MDLKSAEEYNALDASQIHLPTLVIAGEHDPLAPAEYQAKLYTRLATGQKQWVTVPGGDHAAFLESPRAYFIHELVGFLQGVTK